MEESTKWAWFPLWVGTSWHQVFAWWPSIPGFLPPPLVQWWRMLVQFGLGFVWPIIALAGDVSCIRFVHPTCSIGCVPCNTVVTGHGD